MHLTVPAPLGVGSWSRTPAALGSRHASFCRDPRSAAGTWLRVRMALWEREGGVPHCSPAWRNKPELAIANLKSEAQAGSDGQLVNGPISARRRLRS